MIDEKKTLNEIVIEDFNNIKHVLQKKNMDYSVITDKYMNFISGGSTFTDYKNEFRKNAITLGWEYNKDIYGKNIKNDYNIDIINNVFYKKNGEKK